MRGYPGSGKSYAAREMASRTGAVIVCRDTIRYRLFGRYTDVDEKAVSVAETSEVTSLLSAGQSVIVDAMHLNPDYLKRWAKIASEFGADWDVYDVLTDPNDCLLNDADIDRVRQGKSVGHAVINKLATRWPMKDWPVVEAPDAFVVELYDPPEGKPFAIIVDIDGTLAHADDRDPYDFANVHRDAVDPCIRHLVNMYANSDYAAHVIVVSGRDDSCYDQTLKWLDDNNVHCDELHMRKAKDNRKDNIVKYEIFNEHIRERFRVLVVLDDRDQVVKMWRSLDLKCLQVADGDF
jgi:hypothetical protein